MQLFTLAVFFNMFYKLYWKLKEIYLLVLDFFGKFNSITFESFSWKPSYSILFRPTKKIGMTK